MSGFSRPQKCLYVGGSLGGEIIETTSTEVGNPVPTEGCKYRTDLYRLKIFRNKTLSYCVMVLSGVDEVEARDQVLGLDVEQLQAIKLT